MDRGGLAYDGLSARQVSLELLPCDPAELGLWSRGVAGLRARHRRQCYSGEGNAEGCCQACGAQSPWT